MEGAPCTYVCAICAAAEAGAEAEPAPPIPVQPAAASKSGSVTVNKIEYDLYDDGTAAATGGEPTDDVLEIPATITTQDGSEYSVTEIAEWAFEFLYPPITLKLSEGLQKIGAHAFDSAFVEGELVIPDSVTEIGEAAFTWAGVLTKIVIGDGVKSLPASVFESPSSEDPIDVVLGAGLESIDPTAFSSCDIGMVTVYSTSESLKEDISNAEGLMDVSSITYIDPSAATAGELQDAIDAAVDGEEMKIVIDSNYTIGETVTIPENKIITLVDDGKPHTLTSTTDEMFRVEGHLTLASTSKDNRLTFKGGATQTTSRGNIARVINGGTLILEDAVLCGGTITAYNCGAVRVEADSTFRMSGGVIENFEMSGSTRVKGTVSVTSGGRFEMSGGVIRNNENFSSAICQGGGVLLCGWNKDQPYAVMTLSGDAVIEGNFSREGGGIYVVGNAELTMTGGTIQNNEAYSGFGGGVCVAGTGGTASEASEGKGALGTRSKFTMTGGIISENYASRSGGGVYINSDDVVLEGGYITNNEAGNHGGGVYVSEPPQLGTLYNAVVTDNTATVMGGGMWFCPTGDATLSVTNGVALYGNMAMEGGAVPALKKNIRLLDENIGMFCDDTRDAVKGSALKTRLPGFVNGAKGLETEILKSAGAWCAGSAETLRADRRKDEEGNVQEELRAKAPSQIITYVSAHDNQTLWDKLDETVQGEDLMRLNRMAAALYMTCQGTLFLLSGEEFARTKGGHDNSFNAPIALNRLDWRKAWEERTLVEYYKGLIALRKQLPGLCDKSADAASRIFGMKKEDGVVSYMSDNRAEGSHTRWQTLMIIYNSRKTTEEVSLPGTGWEVLCNAQSSTLWEDPAPAGNRVSVEPQSVMVLGCVRDALGEMELGRRMAV